MLGVSCGVGVSNGHILPLVKFACDIDRLTAVLHHCGGSTLQLLDVICQLDVVVIKVDGTYDSVSHPDLYLKRIIGLPGDSIDYVYDEETNTTQLYVNGKVFNEYFYTPNELSKYPTFNTSDGLELFDWAEKCYTGYYPGRDYCETKNGQIVIPEGYYFVLGDNRGVSKDSRNIGLVKEEDIVGKTKYIVNNLFKPVKID